MQLTFQNLLKSGAQGQCGLTGARSPAQRDDAHLGVEQQVQRDTLLRGSATDAERLGVTAHQLHLLVGR